MLKCGIDILFINPLKVLHINLKAFVIMNFMPIPERYSVRLCSLCPLSTLSGWQKRFLRPFYKLRWFPLKALLSFTYMILPCWCKTSMEAALKTSHAQESITLWVVVVFVVGVGLMNHAFSTNATYNELKPIFLKPSDDESFRYLFSHKYFYFNKSCIWISVRNR